MLYGYAQHFYWDLKSLQEGPGWRAFVNRKERDRLMEEVEKNLRSTPDEIAEWGKLVDERIHKWNLPPTGRDSWLERIKEEIEEHRRLAFEAAAWEDSQKWVKVPGETEVIEKLLNASTPTQIRNLCEDAFVSVRETVDGEVIDVIRLNWPISGASKLPSALSQYASAIIEATNHPKFPKSGRPKSRLKQLWFLSRALAAAVHGVRTSTVIKHIGSVRPDEAVPLLNTKRRRRLPQKSRKPS
jgi:hypothetical protein